MKKYANCQKIFLFLVVALLLTLLFPDASFAYIDPGRGSSFMQIIVAVVLGIVAIPKAIKIFFDSLFGKDKS
ncbi:hypothetical protein AGMMS50276_29390 [Synergistales bacterium]|nr:hypothetical protein AGMMS50276_29390 [Synergistales bacterium]